MLQCLTAELLIGNGAEAEVWDISSWSDGFLYSGCEISLIWMPLALCLQNVAFTDEDGDHMSFDECMQLLAETFPLVEPAEVSFLFASLSKPVMLAFTL